MQGVLTAEKGEKITFVFKSILAKAESINLLFVSDRDSFLESFLFIKETIRLIFVEQTRLVFFAVFLLQGFPSENKKKTCLPCYSRPERQFHLHLILRCKFELLKMFTVTIKNEKRPLYFQFSYKRRDERK